MDRLRRVPLSKEVDRSACPDSELHEHPLDLGGIARMLEDPLPAGHHEGVRHVCCDVVGGLGLGATQHLLVDVPAWRVQVLLGVSP